MLRTSTVVVLLAAAAGLHVPAKPFIRAASRGQPRVQLVAPAAEAPKLSGIKYSSLSVGVLKETLGSEQRVAQSPTSVAHWIALWLSPIQRRRRCMSLMLQIFSRPDLAGRFAGQGGLLGGRRDGRGRGITLLRRVVRGGGREGRLRSRRLEGRYCHQDCAAIERRCIRNLARREPGRRVCVCACVRGRGRLATPATRHLLAPSTAR